MEELQILLLLSYLAIGLMSLSIPTYAISVTYLAPETSKSMEEIERRKKELSGRLKEITKKIEIAPDLSEARREILKELDQYEAEEKKLKERSGYLSAKGAVGLPFSAFSIVLISNSIGLCIFPQYVQYVILFSIFWMALGICRVAKTLHAIEQAVLKPEERLLPKFRVAFKSGIRTEKINAGETKEVKFLIDNTDNRTFEAILMIVFPPQFKVLRGDYMTIPQKDAFTSFPDYTAASFSEKVLYPNVVNPATVKLKAPTETKPYKITVIVQPKNADRFQDELTIEVVSQVK